MARSTAPGSVSASRSPSGGPPAWPASVGASTSWWRSRYGSTSSQVRHVSVKPCTRTSGGPDPPRCCAVNTGITLGIGWLRVAHRKMVGRWRMLVPALLTAAALPLLHGEAGQTAELGPRPIRVDGHYAEVWGHARKTVLLLPHGGWAGDGPGGVRELRPAARRFVAMGWRALTVSYAIGAAGLETVAAGWREATRTGPACVYGESS